MSLRKRVKKETVKYCLNTDLFQVLSGFLIHCNGLLVSESIIK